MRVNVVTAYNGRGLERDAEIVIALVERAGHVAQRVQWDRPVTGQRADLNVCLEVGPEWALDLAPESWLIPNPEWWPPGEVNRLHRFARVLCKTRDAEQIMRRIVNDRAEFVGFACRDQRDDAVPRERAFLCIAGKSIAKGADVVIEAWRRFQVPYPLTVVMHPAVFPQPDPIENVTFLGHVPDDELRRLQNAHRFHLAPSWYEGWGHGIHESLSCGALVAVPKAPPMNEWSGCLALIPPVTFRPQRLATTCRVAPEGIVGAVDELLRMNDREVATSSSCARSNYVAECREFTGRMLGLLSAPASAAS